MSKQYAIYARQSIDKADSISIDTQIERCLVEVGDASCQIYSDRGYSGKNTDRPQFQQMLEAVRHGKIDCVVCYKLDRCSRSILDFTQLMSLFQQHDVAFISCTEKFDTATPMGRAMLNICVVFAQLERETIQQRIRDAYHSRCKKGYFMGGRVPFGFTLVPCLLDGKKTSRYEPLEEEVSIMKRIYSLYQQPGVSLADVVSDLRAVNTPNPRRDDGLWIRPHIGRMIKNPIYVQADGKIYDYFAERNTIPDNPREDYIGFNGCYLYQIDDEQHLVLAPHQGIVPSDLWLKCQKTGRKQLQSDRKPASDPWLMGLLFCQKCGRTVVLRQTTGRNGRVYKYYLCSGCRDKGQFCEGFKPFPAQIIEEAVGKRIVQRMKKLSTEEWFCDTGAVSVSVLKEMLASMENTRNISVEQLKLELRRLSNHTQAGQKTAHNRNNPKKWAELLRILADWDALSREKKAKVAGRLIESVKLTDGKITVVWRV